MKFSTFSCWIFNSEKRQFLSICSIFPGEIWHFPSLFLVLVPNRANVGITFCAIQDSINSEDLSALWSFFSVFIALICKSLEAYYCEITPTQSAKIFSVRKSSDLKMIVINRKLIKNKFFEKKMHKYFNFSLFFIKTNLFIFGYVTNNRYLWLRSIGPAICFRAWTYHKWVFHISIFFIINNNLLIIIYNNLLYEFS